MKSMLALALLLCTAAKASTVALKNVGPTTGTYRWQCAATGFADTGIVGACMERHYGVCSGRGCVPKVTLLGIWVTTWDHDGNPTLTDATTTWPGCQGTESVVMINGAPMYLIATDSLGNQLAENNCQSWLILSY